MCHFSVYYYKVLIPNLAENILGNYIMMFLILDNTLFLNLVNMRDFVSAYKG